MEPSEWIPIDHMISDSISSDSISSDNENSDNERIPIIPIPILESSMLRSSSNPLKSDFSKQLPPEAIPYSEFISRDLNREKKNPSKVTKAQNHVRGFYEFGPYGDLCRAWEPILIKHFPNVSLNCIEQLLKDLFSQTGKILVPPQFSSVKSD